MDNVDVRLLRFFQAVMAECNVSRTAVRLGISQPAASQSLARLRVLFQDPLLIRSRGGMTPTDRAREIEASLRVMLDAYARALEPPRRFDPGESSRRFVVSCPEYAEHLLMPELLARLRAEAPAMRVEVRTPQPDRAAELLESGQLDLRIAWILEPPQSLRSAPLFQDRIVCLASRRHDVVQGKLTLAQFLGSPHVRPLGTGRPTTTRVIDEALAREGTRVDRLFLVQNFLTIPPIVAQTDTLATLPRRLALTFARDHSLQVLELPFALPRVRYAAYWHERSQKDAGHRWFRSRVVDVARALRG